VQRQGDSTTLKLQGAFGFLNFVSMRDQLDKLPPGKQLTIDYAGVSYMDHTVNERFQDFSGEYGRTGGKVVEANKDRLRPMSHSNVAALSRQSV
jgi:MFS superfamily sulfate permease-like transporter